MANRFVLAGPVLGLALLGSSAALAGGFGCAECYRPVIRPPVLGYAPAPLLVQPEMTVTRLVRARWATVMSPVIAPAHRAWKVTQDRYGRLVGCWVTVPPRYTMTPARMLVRPSAVLEGHFPAVYGTHQKLITLDPGYAGWAPLSTAVTAF